MSNLSDFIFRENIKSVQAREVTLAGGQTTADVTISAVNTGKSVVIPTGRRGRSVFVQPFGQVEKGDFYDNGPADATFRLINSTTVRVERAVDAAWSVGIGQPVSMLFAFQVVEFN